MAELINMPKLGFDMQEGQLVGWLKQPGDKVEKGDIIAEIESDKATVEVEVFQEGTILELLVDVDSWVPVGTPIAVIGEEGEEVDHGELGLDEGTTAEEQAADEQAQKEARRAAEVNVPPASSNGHGLPDGVRASPIARRLADSEGIDISQVEGTGPKGRIVRADVEAYAEAAGEETHAEAAPAAPIAERQTRPVQVQAANVNVGPDDEVIETSRLRKRIAERMAESKVTAPHFYVTTEIDMDEAMALRKDLNARLAEQGVKISVNDLIVKAAALALREYPNINAAFNGDSIVRYGHINVGVAVAVENGLLNVVTQDTDNQTLANLAQRHKEMIGRAREGKVRPEDLEGETFAVSNLGAFDVDHFIAILNPPNAGILAVGSAKKVPVVNDEGEIEVGWRMKATISADHRVTDGAEAAEFVRYVKTILEDPMRLLL